MFRPYADSTFLKICIWTLKDPWIRDPSFFKGSRIIYHHSSALIGYIKHPSVITMVLILDGNSELFCARIKENGSPRRKKSDLRLLSL